MRINKYNTAQREAILNLFIEYKERKFSVKEIKDKLQTKGIKIGKTTIYRQLEGLISIKLVRKFKMKEKQEAYFEYVGDSLRKRKFHFLCSSCNNTIHSECNHINDIANHIENEHSFSIDFEETTFYGTCNKCVSIKRDR